MFKEVISRMLQSGEGAINRARSRQPAVCYLFDCLYLDGRPVVNEPLVRRREWLADAVRSGSAYRVSEAFDEGNSLFEAVRAMGLEGIVAKQRNSVYQAGKRTDAWVKIKSRQTAECVIVGYTQGKGGRELGFGALHLAQPGPEGLRYVGKVGSGFDDRLLGGIYEELTKLTTSIRPVKQNPLDAARSTWVEPKLMCEVQYASVTKDGMLREPVFIRMRPDLSP
jgi:ATP-dependent DNA ligase